MLSYKYRFHGHGSLRYVYKNGQAIRTHFLTLKYTPNPHRKHPRFAVVVSKKILKSAVGRNRIRRRIYEAIRSSGIDKAAPCDVVIIVSSSEILHQPALELQETTTDLLTQAGLYKNVPKTGII